MATNVIHLPRPRSARPRSNALGLFIRVGRNDHLELLDLLAVGERGIFGFVVDAHNVERHGDLITEARNRGLDVILDPKTQQMGLPGSHTEKLAALPWGLDRHHVISDFARAEGQARARQIVEFARLSRYSLLPTRRPRYDRTSSASRALSKSERSPKLEWSNSVGTSCALY